MHRRIIKQGNNSFTVTLPIKWIRNNNLDGGDNINITEKDNDVIITSSENKHIESTICVDLQNFEIRSIKNVLFQTYRLGFDKIKCLTNNDEQKNIIKKIISKNLLGFEVVNESEKSILIENIAEPSQDKFETLFNKLFFIIKTNANDILEDIKNDNPNNLEKHEQTKNMFDIYTNLLRRLIVKYNVSGNKESYLLFFAVSQLSYIQHAGYYLYKHYSKNKLKKINVNVIEFIEKYCAQLELLYITYAKKDLSAAHKIGQDYLSLKEEMMIYLDKDSNKQKSLVHEVLMGLRFLHLASTVSFGLNNLINNELNLM